MSLSITNNVASLTAQVNLNKTSGMLNTSLERLSSGLKINRGADGPAALVISEEQRAQIAGLNSAINNTAKAVSMVQTTEGALNEVNSLLDKIRSLAIDSANSAVNDPTALAANQAEVTNALATIDRIANNTQFGTKKLLDGSLGTVSTPTDVTNSAVTSQVTTGLSSANLAAGSYHLKITTAFVAPQAAIAADNGGSTITNTVGSAASFFSTAGPGAKSAVTAGVTLGSGVDGTKFFNSTSGVTADNGDTDASAVTNASFFSETGSVTLDGQTYNYTNTTQVGSLLNTINNDAANHFTVSLDDTTHQFTITAKADGAARNGASLAFTGGTYTGSVGPTAGGVDDGSNVAATAVTNASYFTDSGSIVVGNNTYAYTANDTVGSILTTINANDANFTVTLNDSTHKFDVQAKNAGAAGNGVQVQFLGATHQGTVAATTGGADAVAKVAAAGEIVDSTGASLATPILLTALPASDGTVLQNTALGIQFDVDNTAAATTGDKGTVYTIATSGSSAIFQIGANAGQTATLSVASAATTNLGTGIVGNSFANLGAIDVTTSQGSQDALAVIDKAISQISTQRADLGAFQANTLESTSNELQSTLENTTSAESVIRDTDFAAETANFTKAQVLMQVGTTVLQNANQTSQLILSLLK